MGLEALEQALTAKGIAIAASPAELGPAHVVIVCGCSCPALATPG